MTPAARYAAGIEILDLIANGEAAEKILTNWARRNRYAGSGDRAAIRDLVFDVLRKRRSCAAYGGAETGRGLVLGHLRQHNENPDEVFTGKGYAPATLTDTERAYICASNLPDPVSLDFPDWLESDLKASLGADFTPILQKLRDRAAVFLRVNPRKITRDQAIQSLAEEQITASPHPLAPYALEVTGNPRRIASSRAYRDGWVELQDVASQAIVAAMQIPDTGRILDYCAGGGGKSLAIGATSNAKLFAHDANEGRMRDLPTRAKRAGVKITCVPGNGVAKHAPFDMVLCDVPCSGSGAWRRNPDAKWTFSRLRLDELLVLQQEILKTAAKFARPNAVLTYATCSLLEAENMHQITGFLAQNPEFTLINTLNLTPLDGGDGLFVANLRRIALT
jgi:16S rRNA (cytosine967-C5)-methyltransferase